MKRPLLIICAISLAGVLVVGTYMYAQPAPRKPDTIRPPAGKPKPPSKVAKPVLKTPPMAATPSVQQAKRLYPWKRRHSGYLPLVSRFPAPSGFTRVKVAKGSYGWWLRHLPLYPKGKAVRSFRGTKLFGADDPGLAAVVDLDLLGRHGWQHCADTIMRLRAEYHYSRGRRDKVSFRYYGGRYFGYAHWRKGVRPKKQGRRIVFKPVRRPGSGRGNFTAYLVFMFGKTGTMNMAGERKVSGAIEAGHFFIKGGSPGHTVIVLDVVKDAAGKTKLLIGQGFMPAQDLHVLKGKNGSPWYDWDPRTTVIHNPYWYGTFRKSNLKRFRY